MYLVDLPEAKGFCSCHQLAQRAPTCAAGPLKADASPEGPVLVLITVLKPSPVPIKTCVTLLCSSDKHWKT